MSVLRQQDCMLVFACAADGRIVEVLADAAGLFGDDPNLAVREMAGDSRDNARFIGFVREAVANGSSLCPEVSFGRGGTACRFALFGLHREGLVLVLAAQRPAQVFARYGEFMAVISESARLIRSTEKESAAAMERRDYKIDHLEECMRLNNELAGMQRELTKKHKQLTDAYKVIEEISLTDSLTGIGNRRFFIQRGGEELERTLRYGNPLSLLIIDLDHFKQVNDRYGHATGDTVLREFAAVCRGQLRGSDVLCRIGGEEFGVLLINAGAAQGRVAAERIRRSVEAMAVAVAGSVVSLTVSIGVAMCTGDDTLERLLQRADAALYAAKHAGRNRVQVAAAGE